MELLKSDHVDLSVRTIAGLHEAALGEFTRYVTAPTSILDLGAGTGAWAARLSALGHRVTCIDRDGDGFRLNGSAFIRGDLNADFSELFKEKFAAITSIEVIEHLENPRHFLQQCRNLLGDDGIILLTTPNIECVAGRLRFLMTGNFRMFDRNQSFNDPDHISPIQTFMFEKMIRDSGLRLRSRTTSQQSAEISGRLSRFVCSIASPFLKGIKGGDNHIFVLTRN